MFVPHPEGNPADAAEVRALTARIAADTGERYDLDEVIETFGFDRNTLEAELAEDISRGEK